MTKGPADPPSEVPGGLLDEGITRLVLRAFYDVYNGLGFGFLESVYHEALVRLLTRRGIRVEREVPLQVRFLDEAVGWFRADIIVERRVIIEVKSVARLAPAHVAQLTNYLRATDLEVGLVLNFGETPEFRRAICTKRRPIRQDPPCPPNPRPLRPDRDAD